MLDPQTGRTKVRVVDLHSTRYAIARRYMLRVRRDDLDDPEEVDRLAATAGMTPEAFIETFRPLVAKEPGDME